MIARIHVDPAAIRENQRHPTSDLDPIVVTVDDRTVRGKHVEIRGPSEVRYQRGQPLSGGVHVWVEAPATVVLVDGEPCV
ncbi:MAG: hypothetical protein AAFZ07_19565 [Actinomycetota bacterium]